jgi:hypothetical protein
MHDLDFPLEQHGQVVQGLALLDQALAVVVVVLLEVIHCRAPGRAGHCHLRKNPALHLLPPRLKALLRLLLPQPPIVLPSHAEHDAVGSADQAVFFQLNLPLRFCHKLPFPNKFAEFEQTLSALVLIALGLHQLWDSQVPAVEGLQGSACQDEAHGFTLVQIIVPAGWVPPEVDRAARRVPLERGHAEEPLEVALLRI